MEEAVDKTLDYVYNGEGVLVPEASMLGYLKGIDYADLGIKALAVVGVSYLAYKAFDFASSKIKGNVKNDIAARTKEKVAAAKSGAKSMFSKKVDIPKEETPYYDENGDVISKAVYDYLEKVKKHEEETANQARVEVTPVKETKTEESSVTSTTHKTPKSTTTHIKKVDKSTAAEN